MKIQQFQGGLSTRMQPHFIQQNEGIVYSNVDNSLGTLTPVKKSSPSGILLDRYQTYYDAAQQWVSSDVPRDYVEYSGDLYWTDRATQPQKFDGTTQSNLGITVPSKPTVSIATQVDNIRFMTINMSSGGDIPDSKQLYTLVNAGIGVHDSNDYVVTVNSSGHSSFVYNINALVDTFQVDDGAARTRAVTFKEPLGINIGSLGIKVYRLYAGKHHFVGALANAASVVVDSVYDISANPTIDEDHYAPLQGIIQYQMTFYNSTKGIESGPSPITSALDLSEGGTASLTNLEVSTDPQVDKKRIYRIGNNITTMTRVIEIDNADTFIADNIKDTAVEGTLLDTATSLPAPAGLAFLTEAYAMLFAAQGSKLRFTPIGKPDSWPELYFLQFDNAITGIAVVTNGILVFTKFYTYLVTGTGPTSLSQHLLSQNQGCLAYESIQTISGAALWVSSDGICTSSGSQVVAISKDTLGKQSLAVIASVVFDEVYYTLLTDGTMLCFDFAYAKIFKKLSLGNESLAIANDVLYGWSDGEMQILFGGTESEQMQYKSPRFIEGSVTDIKTYKNVRIYHKGDIIISVFIDNELVVTRTLVGEDSTTVKVPENKKRGFFIQFEINGTGEVYEVEYITGHKQNA